MTRRQRPRRAGRPLQVEQLEERSLLNGTALAPLPLSDPAHVLVRYRDGGSVQSLVVPARLTPAQAVAALRADPRVLYAEPDANVQAQGVVPNDPKFYLQYASTTLAEATSRPAPTSTPRRPGTSPPAA